MLLVVGAEPAIIRTALVDLRMKSHWDVAGLEILPTQLPIRRVARDERALHAVLGTALTIEDLAPFLNDLRRHERQAGFAEGRGLPEEDIGTRMTHRGEG